MLFLNDETSPVLDWCDECLNNVYYHKSRRANRAKKSIVNNRITKHLDWIHDHNFFENLEPGQFISDRNRWLDTMYVCPLALMTQLTVFLYSKNDSEREVDGKNQFITDESTCIYFYRPHDGKVMKKSFTSVIHPFSKKDIIMYYTGYNHFNWSIVKDGITLSSFEFCPNGDSDGDKFVDLMGEIVPQIDSEGPNTVDLNTPPSNRRRNASAKSKVALTPPTLCKTKKNAREGSKVASTPPARTTSISRKSKKKSREGEIVIHPNPVSSPIMDKIMNVTPRKLHLLYDGEEVIDGNRYILWKNSAEKSKDLIQGKNICMSKYTPCPFPIAEFRKLPINFLPPYVYENKNALCKND